MKFNLKVFLSGLVITSTLISSSYALADESNIAVKSQKILKNMEVQFESIEEIKDYVKYAKDVNVVLLDEEGTVESEVLSNGGVIDYEYSDDKISKIKNSNGFSKKYTYDNDYVIIDEYKKGKLVKKEKYNKKTKQIEESKNLSSELKANTSTNDTLVPTLLATSQNLSATATRESYYVYGPKGKTYLMNNLISDSDLEYQSLTQSQIQSFLESKGAAIRNRIVVVRQLYYNGPYTSNGENVLASSLIATYSQQYKVNPKLVLVTLQKERSLVTATSINTSSDSVVWAMGAGCYDGGRPNWNYAMCGFPNQINEGTKTIRIRFDQCSGTYPKKKNVNLGRTITANGNVYKNYIWVDNRATESLYIYTPHTIDTDKWINDKVIAGGNYLFYDVFKGFWSTWR